MTLTLNLPAGHTEMAPTHQVRDCLLPDDPNHGHGGPLSVHASHRAQCSRTLCSVRTDGLPRVDPSPGVEGAGVTLYTMKRGRATSTALRSEPVLNTNLHVATSAHVQRKRLRGDDGVRALWAWRSSDMAPQTVCLYPFACLFAVWFAFVWRWFWCFFVTLTATAAAGVCA